MKLAILPIIAGAVFGILAPLLVVWGNPPNMGVCAACFMRDISGALGLHSAAVVQYLRPEIFGIVLGAFVSALVFREFRPRGGSAPFVRFMLGFFGIIGALVFLGCPWRALLRLAGGDLSAIAGILGLIAGILGGSLFVRGGYSLGRSNNMSHFAGLVFVLLMLALLVFAFVKLSDPEWSLIRESAKGPGSNHAPLALSLVAGLVIGALFQKSRFCTVAAIRDPFLFKDTRILQGVLAALVVAALMNIALGQFNLGFAPQPIAHNDWLWNFLGMLLAGLCFGLGGGCPGRQLIFSGEGDSDAAIFLLGGFVGAAMAHNFALASSAAGITANAPIAVGIGLVFCLCVGFLNRAKE